MYRYERSLLIPGIIFLCCFSKNTWAQLTLDATSNYVQLVDSFSSSSVNVTNIQYTGNSSACGYFSGGNSTNLGIGSGIILSTGIVNDIDNGFAYNANTVFGVSGNSMLNTLSGANTTDASVLEFDILPSYDTLSFKYIFGSEDYPEYVGSNPLYLDYIGAFISGDNPTGGNYFNQNFVFVPNTNFLLTVTNINDTTNSQYFVKNTSGSIVFDGFTKLLQCKIPVIPATTYHLIIAIADGGDKIYDSGIFLQSHSLMSYGSSTGIAELAAQKLLQFYPNPANDIVTINTAEFGMLTITNQLGEQIEQIAISDLQTQIVTDNFQSGLYFLTLKTKDNIVTRKLIVQ